MVVFSLLLASTTFASSFAGISTITEMPAKQTFWAHTRTNDPCRGFIFQLILVYAQTVFNAHTLAPKFGQQQKHTAKWVRERERKKNSTLKYYIMRLKRCKQKCCVQRTIENKEEKKRLSHTHPIESYRFDHGWCIFFLIPLSPTSGIVSMRCWLLVSFGCQSIWAHIRFKGVVKF